MDTLEELHETLNDALLQLKTEEYSRILVYLDLPEEGEDTFKFLNTIHEEAEKLYPEDSGKTAGYPQKSEKRNSSR